MTPVYAAVLLCTPTALSSQVFKACLHVCSSKREPLGKGYVRGHQIPNGLGNATPFGVAIHAKVGLVQAQSRHCASACCVAVQQPYLIKFTAAKEEKPHQCNSKQQRPVYHSLACRSWIEQVRQSQPCSPKITLPDPAGTPRTPPTPCMSHPMGHMQQGNNVIGTMTGTGQALTPQPIPLVRQPFTYFIGNIFHRQNAWFSRFTVQHA